MIKRETTFVGINEKLEDSYKVIAKVFDLKDSPASACKSDS